MLKNLKVEFHEFSKKRLNHWQKIYSQPSRSWGSYHKKNIANIYQQNINTRASVLELGSGGGALLAALNPSHGVGIDFCHEAVKMAKNKFPELDFIVADALQALHEEHHGRHAGHRHLGRVVQRPRGELMRRAAGLADADAHR